MNIVIRMFRPMFGQIIEMASGKATTRRRSIIRAGLGLMGRGKAEKA